MFRTLLLACALMALIASGCGSSGDARDHALLASVLQGTRTDLRTVQLTLRPHGGLGLQTTASTSRDDHIRSIEADWDTLLIADGYNEQCVRSADHCIAWAVGPSGGGVVGRGGLRQPLWSARALTQAIREKFAAAGLRVVSIRFKHPYALAPIITVRSSSPRRDVYAFVRNADGALNTAWRHSQGAMVEMFDTHGRVFYVGASSGNTSEGWSRPSLHICCAP